MPKLLKTKQCAISLQHLEIEVNDEVDYLHAGRHENSLQTDAMILLEMVKHFQSSQNRSLQCLYNISKKKLGMEFIFFMQINIKVSKSWHYWF